MNNRLLTSPSRRTRKAYAVALSVAWSYLRLYWAGKIWGRAYYDKRIRALHLRNAERVKKAVLQLQGLFIKVGQLLSILSNFLPDEFQRPLEELQDKVPPRPINQVRQRIEDELGRSPEELFASFSAEPLAAASIGQAHRARLNDGTEVVIKVQHHNIEQIAQVDLQIIDRLQRIIAWWFGIKGIDYVYTQVRQMIEEELDFAKEAVAMTTIGEQLADQEGLLIPQVHTAYSTQRVMTTTWCAGVKINQVAQLDAWQVDRRDLAARLIGAYCQMVFKDGYYHADPHPGNILVQEDGTLVLLDFGAVASLGMNMREGLSRLIEAAVRNDTNTMIEASQSMGFIAPGKEAERMAERMIDALRQFIQQEIKLENLNFKDIEVDPFNNSLFELVQNFGVSGITSTVQVPKEWVLLNRMATLLLGICNTLDPQFNPLGVVRPYVQQFVLGNEGDLTTFVTKLLRDTATSVLALPGELNTVMRQARRGKLAVETPDTQRSALLIYQGFRQLVFTLLFTTSAGIAYFHYSKMGWHYETKIITGLAGFFLIVLWRSLRKGQRMTKW